MRLHTGDQPYPCIACGEGFRTKSELNQHNRAVHNGLNPNSSNTTILPVNRIVTTVAANQQQQVQHQQQQTQQQVQIQQVSFPVFSTEFSVFIRPLLFLGTTTTDSARTPNCRNSDCSTSCQSKSSTTPNDYCCEWQSKYSVNYKLSAESGIVATSSSVRLP